jgi:hypothetical protein
MSPIRQKLLDAIAQTPDRDLEAMLHFLQSRAHSAITQPISTSQQAWNQVVDRLTTTTPEQHQYQRQAVTELLQSWNDEPSDPEVPEESWESIKIALDQNRDSYRPLFP